MKNWVYNEQQHCGVDYADMHQAEIYDEQHRKFRNYEQEVADFMRGLSHSNTQSLTLMDLACGTGATVISASRHFHKVIAVDVSEAMLKQARRKAEKEGLSNIEFIQSGFLSYKHQGEQVDIVMTKAALHHLPDFWKQIALLNMNAMLKLGGVLYVYDVVFQFDPTEYSDRIDAFVASYEKAAGEAFKTEVETHIRDEFSTFDWIMEGLLERAGFEVEKRNSSQGGFVMEYYCRKTRDL